MFNRPVDGEHGDLIYGSYGFFSLRKGIRCRVLAPVMLMLSIANLLRVACFLF